MRLAIAEPTRPQPTIRTNICSRIAQGILRTRGKAPTALTLVPGPHGTGKPTARARAGPAEVAPARIRSPDLAPAAGRRPAGPSRAPGTAISRARRRSRLPALPAA